VSSDSTSGGALTNTRASRRAKYAGAFVVLLAFLWLCDAKLWRPDTVLTIAENAQIAEAQAWWQGRLDLPERRWDTALYNGKAFSHFPPLFSLIAAAVTPFSRGFPHALLVLLVVLPVPLLAYLFFLERTRSPWWGAIAAIGLVCGTSLLPVLEKALRGGQPFFVNHALSTSGLLIMLKATSGRPRPRLACLGLLISTLSRQLTAAYLLPLAWVLLVRPRNDATEGDPQATAPASRHSEAVGNPAPPPQRRSPAEGPLLLVLTTAIVIAVPMVFNSLKFSGPFDSGYMYLYAGRDDDPYARDAKQHGLFSPHFLPRNLYFANLGFPRLHRVDISGEPRLYLRPNESGTGIWWTTPLLLWLFVDLARILRNSERRLWLLAAIAVFAALMMFHTTGAQQRGFNHFSLDYVTVLMALVVPGCFAGRRKWISLAMIAWSVVYFGWLAKDTVRLW